MCISNQIAIKKLIAKITHAVCLMLVACVTTFNCEECTTETTYFKVNSKIKKNYNIGTTLLQQN